MRKIYFLLFLFIANVSIAQVTNEGSPLSWEINPTENPEAVQLPYFDLEAVKAEDAIDDGKFEKPWRFGYTHNVNYGFDDGQWTTLDNGDRIWRLLVESKNALTQNFLFDDFFLPQGASVYLYSDDRTDLLGAYTSSQNQTNGILGTWLVKGEKVWIEYFEPSNVMGQGRLHIAKATHGYRNADSQSEAKGLNDSGDCNLDVDCPIGDDWEAFKNTNKRSAGLFVVGGGACSGALLNNTSYDGTPYFLTANHCFLSDPEGWAFRFGWISPDPVCASADNSADDNSEFTISGASLRANNPDSDFCLVEINQDIPESWDRVWAGWDKSDEFPTMSVGIHHPSADIMKVCRDDDPPIKAPNGNPVAQTWEVVGGGSEGGWELGVTEGGSSGSPLFDQNGRVIGQLYGGAAACSGTVDNDAVDYYGRIAVSWDGNSASERLKDWLDPTGTNFDIVDFFPVEETFNLDASIQATLPGVDCAGTSTTPKVVLTNFGLNEITSAEIEWNIDGGSNSIINFNGSLMQYESIEYELSVIDLSDGDNTLNATLTSVNGDDDENDGNDTSTDLLNFSLSGFETSQIHFELITDDWAEETTWEFRNIDGTVIYSGGPYQEGTDDNTTFSEVFDVNPNQCYAFEINDEAGDGICCGFGLGSYEITTDDGTVIANGGDFGAGEVTEVGVLGPLGIDDFNSINAAVYPNPVENTLTIELDAGSASLNYAIINAVGQQISTGSITSDRTLVQVDFLPAGIYFATISDEFSNPIGTIKFIKR